MRDHSGYVLGWYLSNGQSLLGDVYGLSQRDRLVLCHLSDFLSRFGRLRPDSRLFAGLGEGYIIEVELVQLVLLRVIHHGVVVVVSLTSLCPRCVSGHGGRAEVRCLAPTGDDVLLHLVLLHLNLLDAIL
jgi:hypothetical protein